MKYLAAIVILGLPTFAPQLAAEWSGREEAKWQIAVRTAAKQFEEELASVAKLEGAELDRLTDQLAASIQRDPAGHRRRAQSLTKSEALVKQWVGKRYEGLLAEVVADAARHAGRRVERDDLLARAPASVTSVDRFMESIPRDRTRQAFASARERVVAAGRLEVDKTLKYPAEEELDQKLAALAGPSARRLAAKDFESMSDWVAGQAAAEKSVALEDVETYAREAAERVLGDIKRQYGRQIQALDDAAGALPPKLKKAAELEKNLLQSVGQALAAVPEPSTGGVRYGLFSAVRQQAAQAAQELELRRFAEFTKDSHALRVSPDQLLDYLRSHLAACVDPAKGMRLMIDHFSTELREKASEEYAAGATPDVSYFHERFEALAAWREAISKHVSGALGKALPAVRTTVATEQLTRYFPDLGGDAYLSEPTLAEIALRSLDPATVDGMLAILSLDKRPLPTPADRDLILAECLELATAWTAEKAALGRQAMDKQRAIVAEVERDRLSQLEADVAAGRDVELILGEWSEAARGHWQTSSPDLLAGYPELFEATRTLISKSVRQLYDAKRKQPTPAAAELPVAAAAPAVQKTGAGIEKEEEAPVALPKDPQPEKTPPERQEPEAKTEPDPQQPPPTPARSRDYLELEYAIQDDPPDLRIAMEQTGAGQCVMALTRPGQADPLARLIFDPATIDQSADRLAAVLAGPLRELAGERRAAEAKRGIWPFRFHRKDPEITLYMSVKSPEIRHLMNLRLREALERELGEGVVLRWRVGL